MSQWTSESKTQRITESPNQKTKARSLRFWRANRTLGTVSWAFFRPYLPDILWTLLNMPVFCDYEVEIELALSGEDFLPKVLRHANWFFGEVSFTFFRIDLPKVLQAYLFLTILKCASSSCYTALCTFCRRLSQIYRPATAETETLLRRHQEPHHTQKSTGFRARECFFSPVSSHAPKLWHFPTTWWWGWHDDGVNMVMWFT